MDSQPGCYTLPKWNVNKKAGREIEFGGRNDGFYGVFILDIDGLANI